MGAERTGPKVNYTLLPVRRQGALHTSRIKCRTISRPMRSKRRAGPSYPWAPPAKGKTPTALVVVDPRNHYIYVANLGAQPAALKIDPNGNFLYVANFSGASVAVFAIDQFGVS